MAKYIGIFFFFLTVSLLLFSLVAIGADGGDDPSVTAIYAFGMVTVVLLSFLISLMYYLIALVKKKV